MTDTPDCRPRDTLSLHPVLRIDANRSKDLPVMTIRDLSWLVAGGLLVVTATDIGQGHFGWAVFSAVMFLANVLGALTAKRT